MVSLLFESFLSIATLALVNYSTLELRSVLTFFFMTSKWGLGGQKTKMAAPLTFTEYVKCRHNYGKHCGVP